ncbi:unnamed protein product [Rotaria sp. Silwood1]|nr:unnamed protein product [Rotaria sp. Silwood1]CAF3410585.1 unnamed protein product [Rotaria sp. Silwood1]
MTDAGFFKGTSAEQDSRFANKQKKLLKQMKFPDNIDVKIDMLKVNLDVLKSWITTRLQELLGIEDDVVIEFVFNQLEEKNPDPKMMQINLTGFLGGSKARLFIGELWKLLTSAQSSSDGIPAELIEMKKRELLKRQEDDNRLREIRKREEDSHRQDIKPDVDKLDHKINGRNPMASSSNKSRNENDAAAEYKSRSYYNDDRRDRDRRRSSPKNRRIRNSRSPDLRTRHNDKKSNRFVSENSENEDNNHHRHHEKTKQNLKTSSNRHERHRSPSKSPIHSRSPIKSSRKNEKRQQRSPSSSSEHHNTSYPTTKKSEKIKPKTKTCSSSSSPNDSHSHQRHDKSSRKKTDDVSNESQEIKRQKTFGNNNLTNEDQIKKQPVSKTKRKSPTPSPPRSKQSIKTSSKSMPTIEKSKPKESPFRETKKTKKQSKRTRSSSINSSSLSRSISNSSVSSATLSLSSISESEKNKQQKKKPQLAKTGSSSRSRSTSPNRSRKPDKKKDDHKSRKHSTHNSLELYCKWKPINLDHLDKSITKKTHRNESSKKKTDKNEDKEKTYSNSYQSSSTNNEIPQSPSPKRPRLESQIKVQTPPPKLSDDNHKSQQELVRQPSTPIKPNRTERIVVLEESRTDGTDSISARVSISTKINDNEEYQNNNHSEDENEIDLRERLLREKAIKSMRRRQNLTTNNNTNINTKTTTNDRIVYETQ